MNNLDQRLMQQSGEIFNRCVNAVAHVKPMHAYAAVMAALAPFAGVAAYVELTTQLDLMAQGKDAYSAYVALQPASAVATLTEAVKGNLQSQSLNSIGRYTVAMMTLPGVAAVGTLLLNKFVNMRQQIQEMKAENSILSRGGVPSLTTPRSTSYTIPSDAPRGATALERPKLSPDQDKLSTQLERGIKAIEQSLAAEHIPKQRGPGL